MLEPVQAPRTAHRYVILVLAVIVVLLGMGAFWWWNSVTGVEALDLPTFEIERQADGTWPPMPGKAAGLSVSLSFGQRSTKSKRVGRFSRAASPGVRFASGSILVVPSTRSMLTEAVALRVMIALQADPKIHRLAYAAGGVEVEGVGGGAPAPDIIVQIADTTGAASVAGGGDDPVSMRATMSDRIARSSIFRSTPKFAPRIPWFSQILDVEFEAEEAGFFTANALFAATADDVASSIIEGIRERLVELRNEHGEMPALPASFYPEYRPPALDPMEFADIGEVVCLASWRGLLLHNVSWWRILVPGAGAEAVDRVARRIADSGYRREQYGDEEATLSDGTREFSVFYEPSHDDLDRTEAADAPQTTRIYILYQERASDEFCERAVDATLADEASVTLLGLYSESWNADQRRRGLELLESREMVTADGLLLRARLRERGGDREAAAEDVRRAMLLARTTFIGTAIENRVESAAEEIEVDLETGLVTEQRLLDAGFLPFPVDGDPVEREVDVAAPLRCFVPGSSPVTLVAVGVMANDDGEWCGAMRVISGYTSTQTSWSGRGHLTSTGGVRLEALDDVADGRARVRLTLTR